MLFRYCHAEYRSSRLAQGQLILTLLLASFPPLSESHARLVLSKAQRVIENVL